MNRPDAVEQRKFNDGVHNQALPWRSESGQDRGMRGADYWPEAWKRAKEKAWEAMMPHTALGALARIVGGAATLGGTFFISRSSFADNIGSSLVAAAVGALGYAALVLWNFLVVVPRELWREEHKRHIAQRETAADLTGKLADAEQTTNRLAKQLNGAREAFSRSNPPRLMTQPPKPETVADYMKRMGVKPLFAADFPAWDHVDPLTLRQAACLWGDRDPGFLPSSALDGAAGGRLLAMKQAARLHTLPVKFPDGSAPNAPALYGSEAEPGIPEASTVTRAALRAYAESLHEQPPFLFPEARR